MVLHILFLKKGQICKSFDFLMEKERKRYNIESFKFVFFYFGVVCSTKYKANLWMYIY